MKENAKKNRKKKRHLHTLKGKMHFALSRKYHHGIGKSKIPGSKLIYCSTTFETYLRVIVMFCLWLVEVMHVSKYITIAQSKQYIQPYIEYRESQGIARTTIRKEVSALCKVCGCHRQMFKITAPRRASMLGRNTPPSVLAFEKKHIIEATYCASVGGRCAEFLKLRGRDIKEVNGRVYVHIVGGKGGKDQWQLVLPGSEKFIWSVHLSVGPDDLIFDKPSVIKKLSTHRFRRSMAQKMYYFIEDDLKNNPNHRRVYEEALLERFREAGVNPANKPDMRRLDKRYYAKGNVKQDLISRGIQTDFDRLALMVVSVFCLSHWRASVAVKSYLQ